MQWVFWNCKYWANTVIFTSIKWSWSLFTGSQQSVFYCLSPILNSHVKWNHSNKTNYNLSSIFSPRLYLEINASGVFECFFVFFFTLSGILCQEMMLLLSFLMEPFTLEPVSSGELVLRSHLVIPLWVTVLGTQLMGTNNTGGGVG